MFQIPDPDRSTVDLGSPGLIVVVVVPVVPRTVVVVEPPVPEPPEVEHHCNPPLPQLTEVSSRAPPVRCRVMPCAEAADGIWLRSGTLTRICVAEITVDSARTTCDSVGLVVLVPSSDENHAAGSASEGENPVPVTVTNSPAVAHEGLKEVHSQP